MIKTGIIIVISAFALLTLSAQDKDTTTKREIRKAKKARKMKQGKLLFTPLARPAYTPEMYFIVAGGLILYNQS